MIIPIIIDIVLIIAIIVAVINGYKKGFVDVLISVVAIFVVLILVWIFTPTVTNFVMKTSEADNSMQEKIEEIIITAIGENAEKVGSEEELEKQIKLPNIFLSEISEYISEEKSKGSEKIAQTLSENITYTVFNAIVAISLYVIFTFILFLIRISLSKTVASIPFVGSADKLLGGILNFAKVMFLIYLFLFVILLINPVMKTNALDETMMNTYITKHLYKNNLIAEKVLSSNLDSNN